VINAAQEKARKSLEEQLGRTVRIVDVNEECVFLEIDGVTVTVGRSGAFGVPSVRTYEDGLQAAANARSSWEKQKRRDDRDIERARQRVTGHLNPIVDVTWKCSGTIRCPCWNEKDRNRRRHRSFRKN
jgi:hypothetical protein